MEEIAFPFARASPALQVCRVGRGSKGSLFSSLACILRYLFRVNEFPRNRFWEFRSAGKCGPRSGSDSGSGRGS